METQLLEIDPAAYRPDVLQPAVDVLRGGGLVAFPTETVFGVGALADRPDAIERLRALKERPDQPFTLHIATREQLLAAVDDPPPLAIKLMERFWPGPLTVVVGALGLRMPAARLAHDLIALAGPIFAPSANPRGEAPATTAEGVRAYFDGQVDMVVDGECPGGLASTVVRVDGEALEILRPGPVTDEMIDRVRRPLLLFVCTGNTCRSPMAEAIARDLLLETPVLVDSAGTSAFGGAPASKQAVVVARERGLDLRGHASQALTVDLLLEADMILTMTSGHLMSLVQMVPEVAHKARTLDPAGDVIDPYGGSVEQYRVAAKQIEAAIIGFLESTELT